MSQFGSYFRQSKVWMAIALPITLQIVFFFLMLPALQNTQSRIGKLRLAVVSEDQGLGNQIAGQLAGKLPFAVERSADLASAQSAMDRGEVQMIVDFPQDFTRSLRQGTTSINYTIDPGASVMVKQVMAQAAQSMTAQVNAVAFGQAKGTILQAIGQNLHGMPLPPQVSQKIAAGIGHAISSLQAEPVHAKITGGAEEANPFGAVVPLFVVLLGFVGSIGSIALLWSCPGEGNPWALFGKLQLVLALIAIVLPWVTVALLAIFGQSFPRGVFEAWWLLALDNWAMLLFIAALARLHGPAGLALSGLTVPLQLISAGVLLPGQLLPGFYGWFAHVVPGPYAAQSAMRILSGNAVPSSDIRNVLIIVAVALIVGAAATFIPRKKPSALG